MTAADESPIELSRSRRWLRSSALTGLALLAVACTEGADSSRATGASQPEADGQALAGTWVGTSPSQEGTVTMNLMLDGSYTWSSSPGDSGGTWQADATTLTLSIATGSFCTNGEIDMGVRA